MGARESQEMKRARDLIIKKGYSVIKASKLAGISDSAIYMSEWYKEWKERKKNDKSK